MMNFSHFVMIYKLRLLIRFYLLIISTQFCGKQVAHFACFIKTNLLFTNMLVLFFSSDIEVIFYFINSYFYYILLFTNYCMNRSYRETDSYKKTDSYETDCLLSIQRFCKRIKKISIKKTIITSKT